MHRCRRGGGPRTISWHPTIDVDVERYVVVYADHKGPEERCDGSDLIDTKYVYGTGPTYRGIEGDFEAERYDPSGTQRDGYTGSFPRAIDFDNLAKPSIKQRVDTTEESAGLEEAQARPQRQDDG